MLSFSVAVPLCCLSAGWNVCGYTEMKIISFVSDSLLTFFFLHGSPSGCHEISVRRKLFNLNDFAGEVLRSVKLWLSRAKDVSLDCFLSKPPRGQHHKELWALSY